AIRSCRPSASSTITPRRASGRCAEVRLFDGDAIVLAGATGRVGGATLATLVREGARVLVLSRSLERAARAIDDLKQAAAAIEACVERYGRVDAVVTLAGEGRTVALLDSTLDDLRASEAAFVATAYNL